MAIYFDENYLVSKLVFCPSRLQEYADKEIRGSFVQVDLFISANPGLFHWR